MKRRIDPDQPHVGVYRLGISNVDLYGTLLDYGGSFYFSPDDTSLPRLKVSFKYQYWWEIVAILMHESFEFLAAQRGVRTLPCGSQRQASDIYSFHFDHNAFSQIIEDQAYFLAKCLPDLCESWKQYKPKKRVVHNQ